MPLKLKSWRSLLGLGPQVWRMSHSIAKGSPHTWDGEIVLLLRSVAPDPSVNATPDGVAPAPRYVEHRGLRQPQPTHPSNMFERLRTWYKRYSVAPFVPAGMRFYCLPPLDGGAFEHGVELLNDDATPMPFVVRVLQEEAKLSHQDASVATALCHENGGVIVPAASLQEATDMADRISERSRREAWPLRCKAVSSPGLDPPHSSRSP